MKLLSKLISLISTTPPARPQPTPKPLYIAPLSDAKKLGYKESPPQPEIPYEIITLFNHRFFLYCKMQGKPYISPSDFLKPFTIGHAGPLNRKKFSNMFFQRYENEYLEPWQREALTHNLVRFYDVMYKLMDQSMTNPLQINDVLNEIIARSGTDGIT